MPYGIDKDLGGDSPENVAWVERCVKSRMADGHDKESAIRICKAQHAKKKSRRRRA